LDNTVAPCPANRNTELSVVLLKYRCKLAWQMWNRRGPVVQQAAALLIGCPLGGPL
jgi:hypothetical protein